MLIAQDARRYLSVKCMICPFKLYYSEKSIVLLTTPTMGTKYVRVHNDVPAMEIKQAVYANHMQSMRMNINEVDGKN